MLPLNKLCLTQDQEYRTSNESDSAYFNDISNEYQVSFFCGMKPQKYIISWLREDIYLFLSRHLLYNN